MDLHKVSCLLFFCLVTSPVASPETYTLQKGDSLSSLASKWKLPSESVKSAFPEVNWDKPPVGTKLALPEKHVVVAGDTLYSLARKWGAEIDSITEFNGISSDRALKTGTTLWVPPMPPLGALDLWPVKGTPRAESGKLKSVSFSAQGLEFVSVCDGTVVFQGEYRGVGRVILIEAQDKTIYGYGNFESSAVEFGQKVKKGQILGKASARALERLLFFASQGGEAIDLSKIRREGKS